MKLKTISMVGLVLVSILVFPVIAQTTTVSIEDIQVGPGGSKTVPIYINNVTDPDGVGTVQLTLLYDPSVVQITGTEDADTDFTFVTFNYNNTIGELTVGGSYIGVNGPTGDVRILDVTFTAVGSQGEGCALDVTVTVLKDATAQQHDIPYTVDDGAFTIIIDEEAPIVTDPSVDPLVIPDDTDSDPRWGEVTNLSVTVTDDSAIQSVTINLSAIGGSSKEAMTRIGGSDTWTFSTNASAGTAGWNGSAYVPYLLQVNATDESTNSNTSVSLALTVMKNGDVTENGVLNFGDVTYLANHVVGTPGYESMQDSIGEVSGDSNLNFGDVTYLANHVVGTPGFELLR